MKRLKPQPLTAEEFAPFGRVLENQDNPCTKSGEGWTCFSPVDFMMPTVPVGVGIVYCEKVPGKIDSLERHVSREELLWTTTEDLVMAVDLPIYLGDPYACPNVATTKFFLMKAGQAVILNRGTWHSPAFTLEGISKYFFLVERNSKVDAILLTPLDSDALSAPVEKAMDAGIPVIVIDSSVSTDKYTSLIATDNIAGGKMAMEKLVDAIGGSGEVVVVNALAGIPSNDNRGKGAEGHASSVDGVTVLPQQHCLDQAEAMTATENMIIGNPNLKGIFATFNRGALGAAQAVVNKGKSGEIKIVAFDADVDEIKLLDDGTIDALVVQQPYEMGKLGIEYALKAINGEDVPKTVAPDVVIATKDNMTDEAVHKVLYPKG